MKLIDLDKLKTFYCVATLQSASKAAQQMGLSQSSVSRQILNLEEALNKKLFHRQIGGLILTKHGEILFRYAAKALEDIKTAQTLIENDESEVEGLLKLAVTVGVGTCYLSPFMEGFLKRYPNVRMTVLASDEMPKLNLEEADVAIRPYIEGAAGLVQRPLIATRSCLYASPDYLKKYGTPQTVDDLDNHRLIAFGNHPNHPFSEMDWHLRIGKSGNESREPYIQINLAKNRCSLAEVGLGIVCISQEHPELEKKNLVRVLPDIKGPEIRAYYTYSQELENSKRVLALYEFLVEHFPKTLNFNEN